LDAQAAETVFDQGARTVAEHVEALLVANAGMETGALAQAIERDLRCGGWLRDGAELEEHLATRWLPTPLAARMASAMTGVAPARHRPTVVVKGDPDAGILTIPREVRDS
jgi:hypothetical protein